jgi:hydroxyethylthiazole kinase
VRGRGHAYRDRKCAEILDAAKIDVIKGNSSEIARIEGQAVETKGVDAGQVATDLREVAVSLSGKRACTVVITGAEDIVAGQGKVFVVRNGHPMMANLVGTGCMATSVIGAFVGATPGQIPEAAAAGLACYEIAAEQAVKKSDGPSSFKQQLFDCIYRLDEKADPRHAAGQRRGVALPPRVPISRQPPARPPHPARLLRLPRRQCPSRLRPSTCKARHPTLARDNLLYHQFR